MTPFIVVLAGAALGAVTGLLVSVWGYGNTWSQGLLMTLPGAFAGLFASPLLGLPVSWRLSRSMRNVVQLMALTPEELQQLQVWISDYEWRDEDTKKKLIRKVNRWSALTKT